MSPPPIYANLGSSARSLLNWRYHSGLWQLDCSTMTNSGMEFLTTGFANQDASKVFGSFQNKLNIYNYGITLTKGWNTDNQLFGEIKQRNNIVEGLMLKLEGRLQPSTGSKDGAFSAGYEGNDHTILGKIEIKNNPVLSLSLVLRDNEFLGGVACDYDLSADGGGMSLKGALGWSDALTSLHVELLNNESLLFSLFHKFNHRFFTAIQIDNVSEGRHLNMDLGMTYQLSGYENQLRPGITWSISSILDGKNLNDGNHKFGVGLSLAC
ncbi:voltage-dependent anion-selective channel [Drosophila grimshawi]|uniref:voltage-dependent anion-selective channel n=1 Tax=Drosophila grimshawi TaxID=7222 RepID=UPI000C86F7E6|nr:voltage-dependent anion-selective channel [Drosophila grimshawi]